MTVDRAAIDAAADVVRGGGIVCFPTETFYGLAGLWDHPGALVRLAAAKGRAASAPFALIVPDRDSLAPLVLEFPPAARALADRYWPGPLTIVLPAGDRVPAALRGPGGGVGARMSSHPWAHELAAAVGPVTATSANRSGAPAMTTAAAVREQLGDLVDHYLDGGECPGGEPSTVVAFDGDRLKVVREGAIPADEVRAACGQNSGPPSG